MDFGLQRAKLMTRAILLLTGNLDIRLQEPLLYRESEVLYNVNKQDKSKQTKAHKAERSLSVSSLHVLEDGGVYLKEVVTKKSFLVF